MLNVKSFLAADFGAATLKVAEFESNEAGGLRLKQYGFRSLGPEGLQEGTREQVLLKAFQELLANFQARNVNVCAPGFHVFSKFVKLPPVDSSKVTQIIQYEAQQNVPFPLEEVVWDYQILGAAPTGELEVLLVAIKSDIVEGLFRTTQSAGTKLSLVDVSPAALANAFRYNYGDLEGCSMLLDIGAKTSNLLFFEKDTIYARGINIGANSITVDFAKESKLQWADAEALKIEQGFVSLGGAYEEPDDPNQQAISKIARQVMTRLHIQVNQTIQFYRGQQGGSAPERLFLSGGASTLPYTAQFFAEKLNLPVDYFNPLRNVQIDPGVNLEELAKVGHQMGELVGLGLRNLAHCPIEMNLMPKSSLKVQEFSAKKPYLLATMACLVAILFAFGYFHERIAKAKQESLGKLQPELQRLQNLNGRIEAETRKLRVVEAEAVQLGAWLEDRTYWGALLNELRQVLMRTERLGKEKFKVDTGIWIERLTPDCGTAAAAEAPAAGPRGRGGRRPGPAAGAPGGAQPGTCTSIRVLCRGVDINSRVQNMGAANNTFAFDLERQLQASPMLSTNTSILNLTPDDTTFGYKTFTVEVVISPKRPLKL
jgi:type IV pilus assembly protein PilM